MNTESGKEGCNTLLIGIIGIWSEIFDKDPVSTGHLLRKDAVDTVASLVHARGMRSDVGDLLIHLGILDIIRVRVNLF